MAFNHLKADGTAQIVDVAEKTPTTRTAVAQARIFLGKAILDKVLIGSFQKGDVLAVARLAGIMAAKKTSDLIPLCHPLALEAVDITIVPDLERESLVIEGRCKLSGKTGVEMEALTAVTVAALTVYDMCKSMGYTMTIHDIKLLEKHGGKSSFNDV